MAIELVPQETGLHARIVSTSSSLGYELESVPSVREGLDLSVTVNADEDALAALDSRFGSRTKGLAALEVMAEGAVQSARRAGFPIHEIDLQITIGDVLVVVEFKTTATHGKRAEQMQAYARALRRKGLIRASTRVAGVSPRRPTVSVRKPVGKQSPGKKAATAKTSTTKTTTGAATAKKAAATTGKKGDKVTKKEKTTADPSPEKRRRTRSPGPSAKKKGS